MSIKHIEHSDLKDLTTKILDLGCSFSFRAHGTSMNPVIGDGDVITVRPVNDTRSDIRVGDIVLCARDKNQLIAHRVCRIIGEGTALSFVLRGDNVAKADGQMKPEAILGQVTKVQRGRVHRSLESGGWWLFGMLWMLTWPYSRRLYHMLTSARRRIRRSHTMA